LISTSHPSNHRADDAEELKIVRLGCKLLRTVSTACSMSARGGGNERLRTSARWRAAVASARVERAERPKARCMDPMKLGRCIAMAVEPLSRRPSQHASSVLCGGESAGGGETCGGSTEWGRSRTWTEVASVDVKALTASCSSHSSRRAVFDNGPPASVDFPPDDRGERGERDNGERSERKGVRVASSLCDRSVVCGVGVAQPPRWAIERAISA